MPNSEFLANDICVGDYVDITATQGYCTYHLKGLVDNIEGDFIYLKTFEYSCLSLSSTLPIPICKSTISKVIKLLVPSWAVDKNKKESK